MASTRKCFLGRIRTINRRVRNLFTGPAPDQRIELAEATTHMETPEVEESGRVMPADTDTAYTRAAGGRGADAVPHHTGEHERERAANFWGYGPRAKRRGSREQGSEGTQGREGTAKGGRERKGVREQERE